MKVKVRLSKILGDQRLKVSELSEKSGISRYALYGLYHERTKGIEFETLAKLGTALDCTVCDLLEFIPDDEKEDTANLPPD